MPQRQDTKRTPLVPRFDVVHPTGEIVASDTGEFVRYADMMVLLAGLLYGSFVSDALREGYAYSVSDKAVQ